MALRDDCHQHNTCINRTLNTIYHTLNDRIITFSIE